MSKYTHKQPEYEERKFRLFLPSVWRIMRSSVNDNIPGYSYWLIHIGVNSLSGALFLYLIRHVL